MFFGQLTRFNHATYTRQHQENLNLFHRVKGQFFYSAWINQFPGSAARAASGDFELGIFGNQRRKEISHEDKQPHESGNGRARSRILFFNHVNRLVIGG
jgi:hypothetical protein